MKESSNRDIVRSLCHIVSLVVALILFVLAGLFVTLFCTIGAIFRYTYCFFLLVIKFGDQKYVFSVIISQQFNLVIKSIPFW